MSKIVFLVQANRSAKWLNTDNRDTDIFRYGPPCIFYGIGRVLLDTKPMSEASQPQWITAESLFIPALYIISHFGKPPTRSTGTEPRFLPFSCVYEHFGGNGKCREFAEVSRHKARVAESKSNLRCSRCIGNSFRLRRLTPSSFAVKYGWDEGKQKKEGRKGVGSWKVDLVNFKLDT